MATVRQKLCPVSLYGVKCPYVRTPTRFVVHNTANDAPAENEISYMLSRPEEVSFHLAADDKEIVQGLPFDRNAWASGDGHGRGNMEGIHIEICYSLSGGPRFEKAERNAAEYLAGELKKRGWGLERVTKHQDYDGKYCPHRTLDLGWQRFLRLIESYWEEDEMLTYEQWKAYQERYEKERAQKPVSPWAVGDVERAKAAGLMLGDSDGRFRAQSPVTRQELAAVANRVLAQATGK